MSITPETLNKINSLKSGIESVTGESYSDLTSAVQGLKNGYGQGSGDSGLPDGYRRIDYIKFNGNQVVDSNVICNQNTRIQTCFTRESSAQKYLYGVASLDNTASITAYLGGTWRFGNKNATKPTGTINENIGFFSLVDKDTIGVTGSVSSISDVDDFETIGTLLIGTCRSAEGEVGAPQFIGKIFYFVIIKDGELALKLEPVVSEDGVYRFWDTVSKTFFDSITDAPLEGGNL